ncbi:MAG: CpsD/CapB family tyrosine-protein kinase [Actinomycetota bacterium]|nr:MAG: hypothetical protein FD127_2391 [Acidimicrobiaceae bacterium]
MTGLGRRSILVTAVVCAVGASLLLSATYNRVYQAEATLLLRDDLEPRDEAVLLGSESVRSSVAQFLGVDELPPRATIEPREGTQLIRIVVRSGDARTAAIVANAYADTYIDLRGTGPDTSDYDAALADLRASITGTTEAIAAINEQGELSADNELLRQLYADQLDALEQQLADLLADPTSLGEVDLVAAATYDTKATVPGSPERPQMLRAALLAAAAGLVIGLLAMFIGTRSDDTLRRPDDLAAIRRKIPIIGRIPHDPALRRRPALHRRRLDDTSLTAVHAMRDEVLFLGLDRTLRVIQVCGAARDAGATTIATELALALSEYSSVVLVDLDLRSPEIHRMVGVDDSIGMVDNLDAESIDMTLHPVQERLAVITAGKPPVQPLGLLSRMRLDAMMGELRDRFDVVVLDTPDLGTYGDSTMIARLADAVILVTRRGHTSTAAVRSACRELERVKAEILGFVVNDL